MAPKVGQVHDFYAKLFAEDPLWSTPYPNLDEARRWAKIGECLSQIAQSTADQAPRRLRILDVGCGRGWLTNLANVYGRCDGVDPVPQAIDLARRHFPGLTFSIGTLPDVLAASGFQPYDVVIASEVIEHVTDKDGLVTDLAHCLVPGGHAIITTPRGEEYRKWLRLRKPGQPIEAWISERDLRRLFASYGFIPIMHDRVYLDLPGMSLTHRVSGGPRLSRLFDRFGFAWMHRALQYLTGFYQVWWFQLAGPARP